MLVEADQIVVPKIDWEAAKRGDEDARERLRVLAEGMVLYMHNLSMSPVEQALSEVVTIRELDGVLNKLFVTLETQG